jgi:hypothetical protein
MVGDTSVVPAGHEVTLYSMAVEPGVHATAGNVIIANLGIAGDDGDRELDQLIASIDEALSTGADATLVEHAGPLDVSDLFAPASPTSRTLRSPITWVLHDGNVISTMASEYQRTTLITYMHKLAREGIHQTVYFIDPPEDAVAIFAQHMIGVGVVMRQPDPNGEGLTVQVEVKRPDGVLTVLAGADVPLEGLTRVYAPASLLGLAPQVIKMRVEKLLINDKPIVFRAPKLRARVLELAGAPADAAFLAELVVRDLPLFLLKKPGTDELTTRSFGEVTALLAYVDVIGLHWAAADMKLGPGDYVPDPADPRPLLEHVAANKLGLAIGTFLDRDTPIFVVLTPEMVDSAAKRR